MGPQPEVGAVPNDEEETEDEAGPEAAGPEGARPLGARAKDGPRRSVRSAGGAAPKDMLPYKGRPF